MRVFKVTPAAPAAIRRLNAIALLLVGVAPLSVWAWWSGADTVVGSWIMMLCTILVAGAGMFFAKEAYLACYPTIMVTDKDLHLRRSLRKHVIALERLLLDEAEVVKIDGGSSLSLAMRTNGLHVDGY